MKWLVVFWVLLIPAAANSMPVMAGQGSAPHSIANAKSDLSAPDNRLVRTLVIPPKTVIAGLVPAIHEHEALVLVEKPVFMDHRNKSGDDSSWTAAAARPLDQHPNPVLIASSIDPSKLLVRPRSKRKDISFTDDPFGWINAKQRAFTEKLQATMRAIRGGDPWTAAMTLIALSFAYGIFHAAGPGHGKAVVSAWLLANENQLKRGVIIAFMAASVQAVTAVVIVSAVLLTVQSVGSSARAIAGLLEAASFGMIALLGLYLLWQAFRPMLIAAPAHTHAHGGHGSQAHYHEHHHDHGHVHDENCGCGHAHMPAAADLDGDWHFTRAFALAFAVGIRPCSGAILALIAAALLGIYWAGIAATFAMAIGVAITVSVIAILAVTSRNLVLKLTSRDGRWLDRAAFALKLVAGLFITATGALLFWNALTGPTGFA